MRAAALLVAIAGLSNSPGFGSCLDSQYLGFDSRVTARIIGRLPVTEDVVTAFAVAGGNPVVLLGKRLLVYDSAIPREISLPYAGTGLSVDSHEQVRVQHGDSVDLLTPNGVTPDPVFRPKGAIFASGRPVLMDVSGDLGVQEFVLQRSKDDTFGLVGVRGDLHAAFWGDAGMAAVVDQSLYLWGNESQELKRLAIDKGLAHARAAALVSPKRAVVALARSVVVITDTDQIVLVGMTARMDARNGVLYLLDERTGEIWSVADVARLGSYPDDTAHARSLVLSLKPGATESAPAFLEAARIIGCEEARKILQERPSR